MAAAVSSRKPLPAALDAAALPALIEHLVSALDPGGESPQITDPPDSVELERSSFHPPLEWQRRSWKRGRAEVLLRVPHGEANRELTLSLSLEPGLVIELAGPGSAAHGSLAAEGEMAVAKIHAASDSDRARAQDALEAFFQCAELPLLRLPSTPKKWSRLRARFAAIPRAVFPMLPDGGVARLAANREGRPYYVLAAQPEGHVPLGCLYMHRHPVRLGLSLAPGRPLPRLVDFYPIWPDIEEAPVEPIADYPARDRSFRETDWYGLLRARTGARGRERLEGAIWINQMIREARFSTDPAAAAFEADDACAPWTVEWCIAGNINYVSGHPGGGKALFASSRPPVADEPRRFDVVLFGMTPVLFERWQELFAAAGFDPLH